jgi:anti-anti-sigma factor
MKFELEIIKMSQIANEKCDYSTIVYRINLPKKLDMDNSNDLWIFSKALITGGARKIYIDLKQLEHIDSTCIGVFINSAKLLRKQGGDIILSGASPMVKDVFKVINLENFIKIYNTDIEALNSLRYL